LRKLGATQRRNWHDFPEFSGGAALADSPAMLRIVLIRTLSAAGILLVLAAAGLYAIAQGRLQRQRDPAVARIEIPDDRASIERGRHVATALAKCADCHAGDFGGKLLVQDALFGTLAGPNLTPGPGGIAGNYTTEDWTRAIRHGIGRDRTALLAMPSDEYVRLGRADLAALIAFLRSLPPVDRTLPDSSLGPLGRVLLAVGELRLAAEHLDHAAPLSDAPRPGSSVEYGRYLVEVGCTGCHGEKLSGGPMPGAPPDVAVPSNITPLAIGSWSREDLGRALRQGKRPDGRELDAFMPWKSMSAMSDEEVAAIDAYLSTVEPRPFGGR
jgi:mono/diheme cytochrome c family protein